MYTLILTLVTAEGGVSVTSVPGFTSHRAAAEAGSYWKHSADTSRPKTPLCDTVLFCGYVVAPLLG